MNDQTLRGSPASAPPQPRASRVAGGPLRRGSRGRTAGPTERGGDSGTDHQHSDEKQPATSINPRTGTHPESLGWLTMPDHEWLN